MAVRPLDIDSLEAVFGGMTMKNICAHLGTSYTAPTSSPSSSSSPTDPGSFDTNPFAHNPSAPAATPTPTTGSTATPSPTTVTSSHSTEPTVDTTGQIVPGIAGAPTHPSMPTGGDEAGLAMG